MDRKSEFVSFTVSGPRDRELATHLQSTVAFRQLIKEERLRVVTTPFANSNPDTRANNLCQRDKRKWNVNLLNSQQIPAFRYMFFYLSPRKEPRQV